MGFCLIEIDTDSSCDVHREYRCSNHRCIARYLTCDHHNNCGDHSDEAINCLSKVPKNSPNGNGIPPYQTDENGRPIFSIDNPFDSHQPDTVGSITDSEIPEYFDVPLPTDYPPRTPVTIKGDSQPNGGFRGAGTGTNGGFLKDLFNFDRETSNVVKVVRYLLAILFIIILVTLINFLIWCLITKSDHSFMAPQQVAPTPTVSVITI